MPTFDFQCTDCSKFFEFSRPFGSSEMPQCPKCKSVNTEKLMHAPTIVFKGSGFYKTDSDTNTTTTPKAKADTTDSSKKEEKTETKPKEAAPSKKKDSKKSE